MRRFTGAALALLGLALAALTSGCDEESTGAETGPVGAGGTAGTGGAGATGATGGAGATGATGGTGATGAAGGGGATSTTTSGTGGTGATGGTGPEGGSGGTISVDGCPPVGPFGVEPGAVAPDVTLYDCNGNEHHLNELCARVASYVYTFAPWCPVCQAAVDEGTHQALWEKYQAEDFDLWFVVTSDASGGLPDATDCAATAAQYDLTMPVLYDPTGATEETLGMRQNGASLLLAQRNVIVLNGPWALSMIEDSLAGTFGY